MERFHINPNDWIAISIAKARSGLATAFEYVNACLGLAQETKLAFGFKSRKERERLQMERFHINPDDWIAIPGTKVRSGLDTTFEYVNACLGLAREKMVKFGSRARKERERLQEMLREREDLLAKLLADPSEAIVLTDDFHRLLIANQAALALFGVSKKNINRFTIDAFLPYSQILHFQQKGFPFIRGTVRRGKCEIRRLDGSLRIVEFSFQAHFALGRHLAKFRDVTSQRLAKL